METSPADPRILSPLPSAYFDTNGLSLTRYLQGLDFQGSGVFPNPMRGPSETVLLGNFVWDSMAIRDDGWHKSRPFCARVMSKA
jgi:hypothetical protein